MTISKLLRLKRLYKSLSLLLIYAMISGCSATRKIEFTSYPYSAVVKAGKQKCKTPCKLDVPNDCTHATFFIDKDSEKTVPLPELPSNLARTKTSLARIGSKTCETLAMGFLLLGVAGLSVLRDNDDIDHDDDNDLALLGIGAGGLAIGGLFYFTGKSMDDYEKTETNVHFDFSDYLPKGIQ
ncbi:MAG: hypothetical protein GY749_45510 [Desulfobacteraceae bacterium]|nr:hypothetical protein [Desulfobacteraceae bacterium]